jgi:hypothetical protein
MKTPVRLKTTGAKSRDSTNSEGMVGLDRRLIRIFNQCMKDASSTQS